MHITAFSREHIALFPGTALVLNDISDLEYSRLQVRRNLPDESVLQEAILVKLRPDVTLACVGRVKYKNSICGLARVVRMSTDHAVVEGIGRCRIINYDPKTYDAEVELMPYGQSDVSELDGQLSELRAGLAQYSNVRRLLGFSNIPPGFLVDAVAAVLPLGRDYKQKILQEVDVAKRITLLSKAMKEKLPSKSEQALKVAAGSLFPRQSGSGQANDDDGFAELAEQLSKIDMGSEGNKIVKRELNRLKRMSSAQAEYQVCRTYLETLAEIPWNKYSEEKLDASVVNKTKKMLDEDHYGLKDVKERLIQYLAVEFLQQRATLKEAKDRKKSTDKTKAVGSKAKSGVRPPILLLVGPPGVGKTSLAKSVAKVMDRNLYRISLGGVRDEAEIRGHRRTYVGAMPGIMIQSLRHAGTMNPLIVLDEIDKLGRWSSAGGGGGDPSAAMLEVLDPEQNYSFRDHYVNFPVDLSHVVFIATANKLDGIPRPLLDRMEVIDVPGYTYLEKLHIAKKYLVPKQNSANGGVKVEFTDDALTRICTRYTRESGVRELERRIGAVCRAVAVEQVKNGSHSSNKTTTVKADDVAKYLGLEKYTDDVDEEGEIHSLEEQVGVVNGLAYMRSGMGGIMTFEARLVPSTAGSGRGGKLQLTGQLGDVISESAQIAFSWVKANVPSVLKALENHDVHLHAPAGAIPKDGPSAGVAMTLTFVSLLTKQAVSKKIAMTGEITLRGKVLPVGGIREKLLGAHLANIETVILPSQCASIVESPEVSSLIKETGMKIVYVRHMTEVMQFIWKTEPNLALVQAHL